MVPFQLLQDIYEFFIFSTLKIFLDLEKHIRSCYLIILLDASPSWPRHSRLKETMKMKMNDGSPVTVIDIETTNSCVGIWMHGRFEIITNYKASVIYCKVVSRSITVSSRCTILFFFLLFPGYSLQFNMLSLVI